MNGRPWTIYEREFVRLTYGRIPAARIAEYLARSLQTVYSFARNNCLTKPLKKKPRHWTVYETEFLRLTYPEVRTALIAWHLGRNVEQVYNRAMRMALSKSERFRASPASGRTNGRQGIHTRFPKGHVPWNKGSHFVAGGRSAETRFKPGNRPQTWVPVGTEVRCPDGYLKRKVRDDAPPGMSRFNWKFVHVLVWEEHNGPVPAGHNVAFRNGDKYDVIRIENLELIPDAELARRNSAKRWDRPRELNLAIAAKARLTKEINKRKRQDEEQGRRSA